MTLLCVFMINCRIGFLGSFGTRNSLFRVFSSDTVTNHSYKDFERARTKKEAKNELIRDFLSSKTIYELRDGILEEIEAGFKPNPKRFTYLIRRATTENPYSSHEWPNRLFSFAKEIFDLGIQLYRGNNFIWAEMISCCTRCKETETAEKLYADWRVMREERKMEGGVIVMEAMIAHYASAKNVSKIGEIYDEIRSLGLVTTSFSAASLATSFCSFGEFKKALDIVRQSGNESEFAFNSVLQHMCREGIMSPALELMEEGSKLGFVPTVQTYNGILRCCTAYGKGVREIESVLTTMEANQVYPNEQTWRMILVGLAFKEEKMEYEDKIYTINGEEREVSKRMTRYTINRDFVNHVVKKAKEVAIKGILDPRTSSAAILAYLKFEDVNNALKMVQEIYRDGHILVVEFSVWKRLLDQFAKHCSKSGVRRRKDYELYKEEGLWRIFDYMWKFYEREKDRDRSDYAKMRWRELMIQLLPLFTDLEKVKKAFHKMWFESEDTHFFKPVQQSSQADWKKQCDEVVVILLKHFLQHGEFTPYIEFLGKNPEIPIALLLPDLIAVVKLAIKEEREKGLEPFLQSLLAIVEQRELQGQGQYKKFIQLLKTPSLFRTLQTPVTLMESKVIALNEQHQ